MHVTSQVKWEPNKQQQQQPTHTAGTVRYSTGSSSPQRPNKELCSLIHTCLGGPHVVIHDLYNYMVAGMIIYVWYISPSRPAWLSTPFESDNDGMKVVYVKKKEQK